MWSQVVLLSVVVVTVSSGNKHVSDEEASTYYGEFPPDFLWGLASSAYQIEGGWNSDGKGLSTWDTFTHQDKSPIKGGHTGDVACDSYNKYKEDVQLLKNMGATIYRFSISWPRILPDGTLKSINQAGIDYYNNLINELIHNGIRPMVTMFHWDLPQDLMNIGGLTNEEVAVHFSNYARVLFENYGDRVKHWITINEPTIHCDYSYSMGIHAPGIKDPLNAKYQCAHNLIKAHALTYRIYKEQFKETQKGIVGISLVTEWKEPLDPENPEDVVASHRAMTFMTGAYLHPLIYGEYPAVMRELIDGKSIKEGRTHSRLPIFGDSWLNILKDSLDFIGVNQYSSSYVHTKEGTNPGFDDDNIAEDPIEEEPGSPISWLRVVPWGLRRSLNWIHKNYEGKPIYVTENGFGDYEGVSDPGRVNYFRRYTNDVLKAIRIDGINVKGYTGWSLTDNFEWADGYSIRFGVHYINFSDPLLTRVPKDSAKFLTQLFTTNRFTKENEDGPPQTTRTEL